MNLNQKQCALTASRQVQRERGAEIKKHNSISFIPSLTVAAWLLFSANAESAEVISVRTELQRMRSSDHLFRPQIHRLLQYSGFSRRGSNPDRVDCLYEADGWRVVADHKGPGVVSRIWTTHDTTWREIRIEVDGTIIFTGNANQFFQQAGKPFLKPFAEIRKSSSNDVTAELEAQGRKEWGVCYVPIPFEQRFRYLQRDKLYANINLKAFPEQTRVESFLRADWAQLEGEFKATAAVWKEMNLLGDSLKRLKRINKSVTIPASQTKIGASMTLAELKGPGIVRGIRARTDNPEALGDVELHIAWDGAKDPGLISPLDPGFGSRAHRTIAIGQSADGWRFCHLPMPFRNQATVSLASRSSRAVPCEIELFVEENAILPADVLYLRSHKQEGRIAKGGEFERPELPLADFFYHNGYKAFDHQGAGHIVAYMDLFDCQPELDEHVFIDDERVFPDNGWNGTGHEDLFDMAWGHSPVSAPMTSGGSQDFQEVNVKLFWNDPMTFRKAIRFNWEWAFRFGIKPPRDARFASVVYWYGPP